MITTMLTSGGRHFGITTAPRSVGYMSLWVCCTCGSEDEAPDIADTREQAQEAAEALAKGHVCVKVPADI